MGRHSVDKVRQLCSAVVLDALRRECFARLTLDFDGSVTATRGHAEGTAVGYNTRQKGARSYYNLYCGADRAVSRCPSSSRQRP